VGTIIRDTKRDICSHRHTWVFVALSRTYFASVRNETVWLPSGCDDECMGHKKVKEAPDNTTRISVEKEMAKPRMARSVRIAELNLHTARIPEQPSTTMLGTVDKLIPAVGASRPEKAQIAIDGPDRRYRDLRIENTLTDEHGDDVKLKKGAQIGSGLSWFNFHIGTDKRACIDSSGPFQMVGKPEATSIAKRYLTSTSGYALIRPESMPSAETTSHDLTSRD
jgi:hypothetical protein